LVYTYYLLAASKALTGFPTLESTLFASERVAVSAVTTLLNVDPELAVTALSTYYLVAAS
jgi:hypothetical protein